MIILYYNLTKSLNKKKIAEVLESIDAQQLLLDRLFEELNEVKNKLIDTEDQISESSNLLIKYRALETQYEADLSRLNLTIEGQLHSDNLESTMVCPFCSGKLEKSL